jgi:alpha-1,2-mannosyltransferase
VAVAWTAVFVTRPILWPPWGEHRELGWSPVDHVVGNAYLIAALALAAWAAVGLRRRPAGEAPAGRPQAATGWAPGSTTGSQAQSSPQARKV